MNRIGKISLTRRALVGVGMLASLAVGPGAALAESFDSTEALINLLKEKKILTEEEAATIISRHQGGEAAARPAGEERPVTIIVPEGEEYLKTITDNVARDIRDDVKQQVKLEIKDEVAREVKLEAYTGSVPGWTKRIRFGGDIRLRYQGDFFEPTNATFAKPDDPATILNTTEDRQRLRYRVRVAAKAIVNNQTEAGIRLATGNSSDPISTNDTLGDYQNKDTVTFDRAYIKWTPIPETSLWTGKLDFWGGRFANPFLSSDLVWDSDLNFEGLAVNTEIPFNARWRGILNAGVFPLQEVELSANDKWLLGGQVGIEYAPRTTFNLKLAAAYYDYQNITGEFNDLQGTQDFTAPPFQQKGNAIFDINSNLSGVSPLMALAADYNELNLTGVLDLGYFDPVHVVVEGDYVKNIGFDRQEVAARAGVEVPEEDTGYRVALRVGYPKMQGLWDWQLYTYYKYLEADAVLDAFTDSDFHLGGTNAKGWALGGQLGMGKNLWVNTRWLTTDQTSGPPMAIDVFQFDINSRF